MQNNGPDKLLRKTIKSLPNQMSGRLAIDG